MTDYDALKEALRESISVEDIVDYYGIQKKGHAFLCPAHAKFAGHEDHNIGNCFWFSGSVGTRWKCGCGAGGDIFSLVQEITGCDFISAIKTVAEIAGCSTEDFQTTKASIRAAKERKRIQSLKPFFKIIGLSGEAQNVSKKDAERINLSAVTGSPLEDFRFSNELVKNEYTELELAEIGATYDISRKCYTLPNGIQLVKFIDSKTDERRWLNTAPATYSLQQLKKDDPEAYQYLVSAKLNETNKKLAEDERWAVKTLSGDFYNAFLNAIREERNLIATTVY